MVKPTPRSPHRYAQHLPEGVRAADLEEVRTALAQRFGDPKSEELAEGMVALTHVSDDTTYRLIRGSSGALIGMHTSLHAVQQLFIRPCSGRAGSLTGTGVSTGNVLRTVAIIQEATADAMVNFWTLYAAMPNLCTAPCKTIPLFPNITSVDVKVVRRFLGVPSRVTATVDYTCSLWCV